MSEKKVQQAGELKKSLSPIGLWAIAVGLVVSGDYYGFAYGFEMGGPVSFLVSFIPVTLMYVPFLFCYTERISHCAVVFIRAVPCCYNFINTGFLALI